MYKSRGYGNAPMGSKKKLTDAQMKRLEEHSKKHKGGMGGKHMKNMVKGMKEGKTFTQAHNEAMKKDKMGEATLGGKKIEFVKGALHKQLKVADDYKFTKSELERLEKINNGKQFNYKGRSFKMTDKLKKRITFGLNLMKRK